MIDPLFTVYHTSQFPKTKVSDVWLEISYLWNKPPPPPHTHTSLRKKSKKEESLFLKMLSFTAGIGGWLLFEDKTREWPYTGCLWGPWGGDTYHHVEERGQTLWTGSGIYLNWGTGRSRGKKVAVNREWKSFFCKGISAGSFHGAEVPGGEKGNLMLPASPAQFC